MDAKHFNVLTAIDSAEKAQKLARAVDARRVAACAQVTPIRSTYRWRGQIHDMDEWRLDCKTSAARLSELMEIIRDLHPFELPEIIALPITDGNPGYLQWIDDETAL